MNSQLQLNQQLVDIDKNILNLHQFQPQTIQYY
jgi:hypothetical protein